MGLMADYASFDASGKLYLIGVFGRVISPEYPFTVPMMHLALKVEVPMNEWGTPQDLTIQLIGEDKPEPFQIGPIPIEVPAETNGLTVVEIPVIARVEKLTLSNPGAYHWCAMIGSKTEWEINMAVSAA